MIEWIIAAAGFVLFLVVFFIGYAYGRRDSDLEWKREVENWKVVKKDDIGGIK
jgi:hypothetical protein